MSNIASLHTTPSAEQVAAKNDFFKRLKAITQERRDLVIPAIEAMARLAAAMQGKSGQAYRLRTLLFSLWNGKPVDLSNTLHLDWELKKDFSKVMLAFGHDEFFYNQITECLAHRGLVEWFKEEGDKQ